MQIVEKVRAAALAAEEQDLVAVLLKQREEGWGWLSVVGNREFWRVNKGGVGGDPTRTVWETEGRFGAVGRARGLDTHPDGGAAMQVPRRELSPILELCVGREWARSAHVRGEVVGRGSSASSQI